jgi:hypothetical protein
MADAPGVPYRHLVHATFGRAFLFASLHFTPIHLAGWDHDLCFAVAHSNGDISRGIS